MSQLLALYPGTFDPVTRGHLDVIERAAALFDRLAVCVAPDAKTTYLPREERVALLEAVVAPWPNVAVEPFDGLLAAHARQRRARVLVRGLRGLRDFEYEREMAFANQSMVPEIETVFLVPSPEVALVSSSLVREVASLGGDVSAWVPPVVAEAMRRRPPPAPVEKQR